jgi:hypothetical protein
VTQVYATIMISRFVYSIQTRTVGSRERGEDVCASGCHGRMQVILRQARRCRARVALVLTLSRFDYSQCGCMVTDILRCDATALWWRGAGNQFQGRQYPLAPAPHFVIIYWQLSKRDLRRVAILTGMIMILIEVVGCVVEGFDSPATACALARDFMQ